MAISNLSYVISILKGDLKGLDEILSKLGELRKAAEAGAKFNIELNAASVEAMRKQVKDALGSSIKVDPAGGGGGGGTAKMDPQLAAKLDTLVTRMETVAAALQRAVAEPTPRDPKQPGGMPAFASVQAEASSFREQMRVQLQNLGLGANVDVVTSRKESDTLFRSERRQQKADAMPEQTTSAKQVKAATRHRDELKGLMQRAEDELTRLADEMTESERKRIDILRDRLATFSARKDEFFERPKDPTKSKSQQAQARRDVTKWAQDVISVVNEVDAALGTVIAATPMRSRVTGPGSGAALRGEGGTNGLPFNATMLSASLTGAMKAAAPDIGREIGRAVKSALRNIRFAPGDQGDGGGEFYTRRESSAGDARSRSWTRAAAVTPNEAQTILADLKGNDLARAVQAERQAKMAMESAERGYLPRIGQIVRQLRDLDAAIESQRAALESLNRPELNRSKIVREQKSVMSEALDQQVAERARLVGERDTLMATAGDRSYKAGLDYAARKAEREKIQQATAMQRMGYGSELDQATVENNPESIRAMTLRQINQFLTGIEARYGGGVAGAEQRNAAIAAATSGYMPIDVRSIEYQGSFFRNNAKLQGRYANITTKRDELRNRLSELEEDLTGEELWGDGPNSARARAKQTAIEKAKADLREVEKSYTRAMVKTLQEAATGSLEAIAELPSNLLAPNKTEAEVTAIRRNLRDMAKQQTVGVADPNNAAFTDSFAVIKGQAFSYLNPILKEAVAKIQGGASFADMAPVVTALRSIPLLAPSIPGDAELKSAGALDQLAKTLANLGTVLQPAYNLTTVQGGVFNKAAQPLMPDGLLPAEKDEYGNPYRLPLSSRTISMLPPEQQPEMNQLLASYMANNNMRFAVQSERRRAANERWMETLSRTINTIERGELPGYIPLGNVKSSMVTDEVTFQQQLKEFTSGQYEGAYTPEFLAKLQKRSENMPRVKINPDNYKDTLDALRTALGFATTENLAGGTFYNPQDPWAQQRVFNGMLVTTGSYRGRNTRGEYDPTTGRALSDIKPFDMTLGLGGNQAEVLAAEAALAKMNSAVTKMIEGLSKLTGVADPLAKALEPVALVAERVASAMARVEQTLGKVGYTGRGKDSGSGSGLSAIMTAEAKKDIRVAQQRELREDKERAALLKEQEKAIRQALDMEAAESILGRIPKATSREYGAMFESDPRQFRDLLKRTIGAAQTNRFRQEQLGFDIQGSAVGSDDYMSLTGNLRSAQRKGYARNLQMVLAALGADPNAEVFAKRGMDMGTIRQPLEGLRGNLEQLLPATRAFENVEAAQRAMAASQAMTNEAEARFRQFETLKARYENATKTAESLQKNINQEVQLRNQQRDNSIAQKNLRRVEDLPTAGAVSETFRTASKEEAARWLAKQLYSPQTSRNESGERVAPDTYEKYVANRLFGKDAVRNNTDPQITAQLLLQQETEARNKQAEQVERERRGYARQLRNIEKERTQIVQPGETPQDALARYTKQGDALKQALVKVGEISDLGAMDTASQRLKDRFQTNKSRLAEVTGMYQAALAKAGEILKQPGKSEKELAEALGQLTKAYRALVPEALAAANAIEKTLREQPGGDSGGGGGGGGAGFVQGLANKFQSILQYAFAGGVVYTFINKLKQEIAAAVQVEAEGKRLQGILGSKSDIEAQDIVGGAFDSAQATGTNVMTALQMSRIFAQTGRDAPDVQRMTRAALEAQVGAGLEGTQASEFLIAVDNVSKGTISAADIVDRISRVESQYAVSARDLSVAIQRAGSLAQQLQPQAQGAVSAIDLIIGSATAVIERTRVSGEQAATSLRFIFSRLLQPEVGRALQDRYGIELGGATPGSMRPLQEILQSVAGRYQELNQSGQTAEASNLLVTFAGARQANAAAALLEDFSKAMDVATSSARAYGDTQQRLALQLDTIQAQYQRLQTSITEMFTRLLSNSGSGQMLKRLFGSLADGADAIGGSGGALAVSGGTALTGATIMMAMRGLAAGATAGGLGGAATALGLVAGGGELVLVLGGLLTAFELFSIAVNRLNGEVKDAIPTFDQAKFAQSEFYRGISEQTRRVGLSPESAAATMIEVSREVNATLRERFGAEVDNPNSPRSPEIKAAAQQELLRALTERVPNLGAMGTSDEQLAYAQALLTNSIKTTLVPSAESLSRLNTQLANTSAARLKTFDQAFQAIEESTRFVRRPGMDVVGFGAAKTGVLPMGRVEDSADTGRVRQFGELRTYVRTIGAQVATALGGGMTGNELTALGFTTKEGKLTNFEQVVQAAGPMTLQKTLDLMGQTARENLLLPENNPYTNRLKMAAADMSEAGEAVTQAALMKKAMEDFAKSLDRSKMSQQEYDAAMTKARDTMTDSARIVANQEQLIAQIVPSLAKEMKLPEVVQGSDKATRDLLGMTDGQKALDATYRQIFTQSIERLKMRAERALQGTGLTAEERKGVQASIGDLTDLEKQLGRTGAGSLLKFFDRQGTRRVARERVLEPYVNYGTSLGEIRGMAGLQQQFGIEYDPMRAQYDAALRFRQQLATNDPRLIGEMVRSSFSRILANGMDSSVRMEGYTDFTTAMMEGEGGRNITRLSEVAAAAQEAKLSEYNQTMQTAYEQLEMQLKARRDGLSTLFDTMTFGKGDKAQEAMTNLRTSLDELIAQLAGVSPTAKDGAVSIAQVIARLRNLDKTAMELSEQGLRAFIQSERQRFQAQRDVVNIQAAGQRQVQVIQANNQVRMLRLQGSGARQPQLLAAQLEGQADLTSSQLRTADEAYIKQRMDLDRQLAQRQEQLARLTGESRAQEQKGISTLEESISNLENNYLNSRRGIIESGRTGAYVQFSQAEEAARGQQTQELRQAYDGMITQPLRQLLSSYRNFTTEGLGNFVESIGRAAQDTLVNNFLQQLSLKIEDPIVGAFRQGGLFTKEAIIEGFREALLQANMSLPGVNDAPPAVPKTVIPVSPTTTTSSVVPKVAAPVAAPVAAATTAAGLSSYFSKLPDSKLGLQPDLGQMIYDEAVKKGIDPAIAFSMIYQESRFDPNDTSPAGARGLGQLMPDTARGLGLRVDKVVDERRDRKKNISASMSYLQDQLSTFTNVEDALAAYNAGPGTVRKVKRGKRDYMPETKRYVPEILDRANKAREATKPISFVPTPRQPKDVFDKILDFFVPSLGAQSAPKRLAAQDSLIMPTSLDWLGYESVVRDRPNVPRPQPVRPKPTDLSALQTRYQRNAGQLGVFSTLDELGNVPIQRGTATYDLLRPPTLRDTTSKPTDLSRIGPPYTLSYRAPLGYMSTLDQVYGTSPKPTDLSRIGPPYTMSYRGRLGRMSTLDQVYGTSTTPNDLKNLRPQGFESVTGQFGVMSTLNNLANVPIERGTATYDLFSNPKMQPQQYANVPVRQPMAMVRGAFGFGSTLGEIIGSAPTTPGAARSVVAPIMSTTSPFGKGPKTVDAFLTNSAAYQRSTAAVRNEIKANADYAAFMATKGTIFTQDRSYDRTAGYDRYKLIKAPGDFSRGIGAFGFEGFDFSSRYGRRGNQMPAPVRTITSGMIAAEKAAEAAAVEAKLNSLRPVSAEALKSYIKVTATQTPEPMSFKGPTLEDAYRQYSPEVRQAILARRAQMDQMKVQRQADEVLGLIPKEAPVKPRKSYWGMGKQFTGEWGAFANTAMPLIGSLGGAALGNAVAGKNKGNNFAQEGSAMGAMLLQAIPGFQGPIGGMVGGLLGGLVGGLFGKDKKDDLQTDALQKIERNTRESVQAFENQTQLLQLDSRFLNVPTAFALPAYRPGMVGSMAAGSTTTVNNSVSVSVTASANMNAQDLANEVAAAIRQELGRAGNSFDIRTM